MSSSKQHWLHRCSSRWDSSLDREDLSRLKAAPEIEALKVWLAFQARLLVEALVMDRSLTPLEDHSGHEQFIRGELDMIRKIVLELDRADGTLTNS